MIIEDLGEIIKIVHQASHSFRYLQPKVIFPWKVKFFITSAKRLKKHQTSRVEKLVFKKMYTVYTHEIH